MWFSAVEGLLEGVSPLYEWPSAWVGWKNGNGAVTRLRWWPGEDDGCSAPVLRVSIRCGLVDMVGDAKRDGGEEQNVKVRDAKSNGKREAKYGPDVIASKISKDKMFNHKTDSNVRISHSL